MPNQALVTCSRFSSASASGLFVAAQIGPVSLLIVRSVLRGNFRIGLAMAAAVALVDLGYAALGLLGVARALEAADEVGVALGFVGAAVLVALGLRTMWIGFRARFGLETQEEIGTPRRAFATAFAATALNPLTIALWTAAAAAAVSGGSQYSFASAALLVGVGFGTLTWYTCFAGAIALARRRIGPRLLAAIDIGAGAGILGVGAYLGYRTARS
jgi:putative LysE/RhtB family amino acid efflux pump